MGQARLDDDGDSRDSTEKFVLSTTLGAGVGVSVVLLKLSISAIQSYSYNGYLEGVFGLLPGLADTEPGSALVIATIPALGGVAVSVLNLLGGNEMPLALKGLADRTKPLSLRAQLARSASAAATLGTGNSLGPEGPSVELGAVLARALVAALGGEQVGGDVGGSEGMRAAGSKHADLLFCCGAAAGVAAGFNAPIAACFFAIEVIQPLQRRTMRENGGGEGFDSHGSSIGGGGGSSSGSSSRGGVGPTAEISSSSSGTTDDITYILLASAMAALAARVLLEEKLSFKVAEYTLASPLVELPLYLGLGALSGFIASAFKGSSAQLEAMWQALDQKRVVPRPLQPAAAGLACGAAGLLFPQVLFFGYATLDSILAGDTVATMTATVTDSSLSGALFLAQLCGLKLFLTALCATSGLVGGTFAPSLFLGATAGAAYQNVAEVGVAQAAHGLVELQTNLGVVPGAWGVLPQLQVRG